MSLFPVNTQPGATPNDYAGSKSVGHYSVRKNEELEVVPKAYLNTDSELEANLAAIMGVEMSEDIRQLGSMLEKEKAQGALRRFSEGNIRACEAQDATKRSLISV